MPLHRKNKKSAAQSVAEQAANKAKDHGAVVPILINRVEGGSAIFPQEVGSEPLEYDVAFLAAVPGLKSIFEAAFLRWAPNRAHASRIQTLSQWKNGLFAYIGEKHSGVSISPYDLDDEFFAGFRGWLLTLRTADGPFVYTTINGYINSIREPINALDDAQWKDQSRFISGRLPSRISGEPDPTEVLPIEDLINIMEAAEKEIIATWKHWEEGGDLVLAGIAKLRDGKKDYRSIDIFLARMAIDYSGMFPIRADLKARDRGLAEAMNRHGAKVLASYFYPTARMLVPFAILLCISAVFNPDTVLTLEWNDIDREADRAGIPAIKITGKKGRAAKNLVRLLDPKASASELLSLENLLGFLEIMTSRIRPHAQHADRERLFLFVPEIRTRCVRTFMGKDGRATTINWQWGLTNFIKDNQLPYFTLSQLRPTIIDMVQALGGGLEEARLVGDHRSLTTTWNHYTSDGVRKLYRGQVGEVIMLRERWIDSEGKIDPRGFTSSQDNKAATPGFDCLDPFDSPAPLQRQGSLCNAYGYCPACPLAAARPHNPINAAFYVALQDSLYSAQSNMSPKSWIAKWARPLVALKNLLVLVPSEVLEASRKTTITLPPVG